MSNPQLYILVGLPTIAVISFLTVSLFQIRGLRADFRADLNQIRSDFRADLNDVRSEIRGLRQEVYLLAGKVIELMDRR